MKGSICDDCKYNYKSSDEKPCRTCMQYVDGYLDSINYEPKENLPFKDVILQKMGKNMLNNQVNISSQVNAVTGSIIKTYEHSYFLRFHLKSDMAGRLFRKDADEVIIQMVVCGDMEVIAEVMDKKIYNKMFESKN